MASFGGRLDIDQDQDPGRDFFISYTRVDVSWAEWIAVELERANHTTLLQAWDFRPGRDFLHEMQDAATTVGRTIAVLSPAYFESEFSETEWRAAFAKDPTGRLGLLIPVRVQHCEPPGLLASRVYVDLVDKDEDTSRRLLLAAVSTVRARPITAAFPGSSGTAPGPRPFPGLGLKISNLPARNRNFSGRDDLLGQIHTALLSESAAPVVPTEAVHGLGGIGKTELALEYAYRFAADYDIAWWLPADQPTATVAGLAGLAERLGIPEQADRADMTALFEQLRRRDRWLLVYDNAERPEQLTGLLPTRGGGHVLLTSRWSAAWSRHAISLRLGVLSRGESVGFLQHRIGVEDPDELAALADLLGDLPLALEEAAAYLEETGESVADYLGLVHDRAGELFGLEDPFAADPDHRRVATVWSVSLDRLRVEAPLAEELLNLCAFLAPEVPRELPPARPELLPGNLATVVANRLAYNRLVAAVARYSLATASPTSIGLHRLVQVVIQSSLNGAGKRAWADAAATLLRSVFPEDCDDVSTWSQCERLLPSLLVATGHAERLGVAVTDTAWLLDRAATYLHERGQYQQAREHFARALRIGETALGPNHPDTLACRGRIARLQGAAGDPVGAVEALEDLLADQFRVLGPDHRDTLTSRRNIAHFLGAAGDPAGAVGALREVLADRLRVFGPDDPGTLTARNAVAYWQAKAGDPAGAAAAFEDLLGDYLRVLGSDHPDTLRTRNNLAYWRGEAGDAAGAAATFEDLLGDYLRVLGSDHPHTLRTRNNLAHWRGEARDATGAVAAFVDLLGDYLRVLGPDHPHTLRTRSELASSRGEAGDAAGAAAAFEDLLTDQLRVLGSDHPDTLRTRGNLAKWRGETQTAAE